MKGNAEEPQFEVGATVKLQNLKAAAEHNGCDGELLRFDTEKGRWAVRLEKDGQVLGVKPENMILVRPAPKLHKLDVEEEDDDDPSGRQLKRMKRNFDRIVKKYNL
eukprot:758959-Hanusia_phi.AAC.3